MFFKSSLLLALFGALFFVNQGKAQINLKNGVYVDQESDYAVEVKDSSNIGFKFIRMTAPHYHGFWLNTWSLDGYMEQFNSGQVVDLSPGSRLPIPRDQSNIYQKTITELDGDRLLLEYSKGRPSSFYYRRFSLVIDLSSGHLLEFEHEKSWAKNWGLIRPTIGNYYLFKLRLHSGPFFRDMESSVKCETLILREG